MKAKTIIKNYDKIFVLATDGNTYKLSEYYPIVIEVKNEPEMIYLDTGGKMSSCDFFRAKIKNKKLIKELDNKKWIKIGTLDYSFSK